MGFLSSPPFAFFPMEPFNKNAIPPSDFSAMGVFGLGFYFLVIGFSKCRAIQQKN